jgi:hypothetical protein
VSTQGHPSRQPIPFGLALTAGGGLILMILALGIGVLQGTSADSSLIGLLFVAGLLLLVAGVGAWAAVVRPFANFDDINVPKDSGHHGHDEHAEEELLLPDGVTPLVAAGEHETPAALASGHH